MFVRVKPSGPRKYLQVGEGRPVSCEMWPGNKVDVKALIPAVDRLRGRFGITRATLVADRGMISKNAITELERRSLGYILEERMRRVNEVRIDVLTRAGRFREVRENLRVKDVTVSGRGYVVCLNPEEAEKDTADREAILALFIRKFFDLCRSVHAGTRQAGPEARPARRVLCAPFGRPNDGKDLPNGRRGRSFPGRPNSLEITEMQARRPRGRWSNRITEPSDEPLASLEDALKKGPKSLVGNKGYRRYLSVERGSVTIDGKKAKEEARYLSAVPGTAQAGDGKFVLRTNLEIDAGEVAVKYKEHWRVERAFRTVKSVLETRPIYHKCDETILGHVFASFLALVIMHELDRRLRAKGLVPVHNPLRPAKIRFRGVEDGSSLSPLPSSACGDVGTSRRAVGRVGVTGVVAAGCARTDKALQTVAQLRSARGKTWEALARGGGTGRGARVPRPPAEGAAGGSGIPPSWILDCTASPRRASAGPASPRCCGFSARASGTGGRA